jgi:hypothetical protein
MTVGIILNKGRRTFSRCSLEEVLLGSEKSGTGIRESSEAARLLYVAGLTGARFSREGSEVSPLAWLTHPSELFDGRSPFEACQDREGFRRAVLLHELALGMSCSPELLVGLSAEPFLDCQSEAGLKRELDRPCELGSRHLFTSTLAVETPTGHLQGFCAFVVGDTREARRTVRARYGALLEEQAEVRLGFDPSEPVACSLVSDALCDILLQVEGNPWSELAEGFSICLEQRFAF